MDVYRVLLTVCEVGTLSVIGMGKTHFLPSGNVVFSAYFNYCTFFTVFSLNEKNSCKLSVR